MSKKYDKLTFRNLKVIIFRADHLSKPMRLRLRNGHATIMDVRFRDIKAIYKNIYSKKIKQGYSFIIEYRGNKKILIYN